MGKKSSSKTPMKIHKQEKKQHLNSLIKILRPKVYITDSSNFKNLVQELTGNGKYSPVPSPPPSTSVSLSPPPFAETHEDHAYQENSLHDLSFDSSSSSSCFSTPLEGSPDLSLPGSLNYVLENSLASHKMYKDLESMLMEMDSGSYDYDACYGMFQQEVCVYDYDLSTLI
ncbi:hypothetical protein Pfo_022589 [Paulownia fortunei]|nr:hypothetical protein Pfo_022589 [Paulownia fortunei]